MEPSSRWSWRHLESRWWRAPSRERVAAGSSPGWSPPAFLSAVAFAESVRRRIIPWLVTAAVVLGVPAGAVASADIHFSGSIGERTYTPTAVADLHAATYELGTGQLIVDLRRLPWEKDKTFSI